MRIIPFKASQVTELHQVFQHFAARPWSILLDSSNSDHVDSHFDILVSAPIATIETTGDDSKICFASGIAAPTGFNLAEQDDPIGLLHRLSQTLLGHADVSELAKFGLPFGCGAVGYYGYDLGRRFERDSLLPRPQYSTPDMAQGIYSWSLLKDKHNGIIYFCYLPGYPHPSEKDVADWLHSTSAQENTSQTSQTPFSLSGHWHSNLNKDNYLSKMAQIDNYLRAGDCYQVNFAQRFHASYQGDEYQAYLALRQANRAPFSAFIRLPQSAILSISPERFLQVKQDKVQTKPIKGTRPRYLDPIQDQQAADELQHAEKDRAENLMIVDLLRNDVSKHCQPGSVNVPNLFAIESFPAVHHLVSTVVGELNQESTSLNLLRDAFPGGSITGAPKIRAMQIIDELEPDARNIYCGSIGYLSVNGDMDTNICIRTLLCEQGTVYCWAGGGIVLDSDADAEYQETLDKVAKILPVLEQSSSIQRDDYDTEHGQRDIS